MPSRLDGFHDGEAAMREMLKVPPGGNPTVPGLPMPYAMRVRQSPLVAVGTLDDDGRPWTTVWGGERGFAGPIANGVLGFNSSVDVRNDPVFESLFKDAGPDGIVRPDGGEGKMMSALAIDLETRDRVKLAGVMVAGSATKKDGQGTGEVQAAMVVTESLGNCPKYLNKKDIVTHDPEDAQLVSDSLPLPHEAVDLVHNADMFFLSSTNGPTMDTNHRGGSPGFMRVIKNEGNEVELVYPEFSGNRLYQTLGNLKVNPLIGIAVPDYDTSDVLYLTGRASILVGEEASSVIARTQLAVKITVSAARFVKSGLPFRGAKGEYSPYNPPLRYSLAEKSDPNAVSASEQSDISATLINREELSPSISIFTFKLESIRGNPLPKWEAGQHVTLNFEPELGMGYSHMRDEDPQSINDDFIRTFTVSSAPGWRDGELQITARRHGPATGLLWRHNLRAPLEIPVMGFGGEATFRLPTAVGLVSKPVFVAGGVGITPVISQARAVLDAGIDFTLLWSLRGEDLPLAVNTFDRIPGLAAATNLLVTGREGEADPAIVEKLKEMGVKGIEHRRLALDDVKGYLGQKRKFYLCAGPTLLRLLTGWLDGEDVVWEDFNY